MIHRIKCTIELFDVTVHRTTVRAACPQINGHTEPAARMNYWLVKSEPSEYSFDKLVAAKREVWDGVRNAAALQFIRQMKKGDRVLVYHSGKDKCVVGIAEIVKGAYADPSQDDDKFAVVDLKPVKRLPHPVPLADIKSDKAFADFHLVRISRLSVMPVAANLWKRMLAKAGA